MLRAAFAIGVAIAAWPFAARADDGVYYEENAGVSLSRGRLGEYVDGSLHMRVGLGVRSGSWAIEGWLAGDLDTDRSGAAFSLVGGAPAPGGADLASYGTDVKYLVPLYNHVEVYARGGVLGAYGTGALDSYHGAGLATGAGIQLTGSVRALGFLFVPWFWSDRGPLVTGGVFIDEGIDFYRLRSDVMPPIDSRVGHINMGFAIGSAF